MRGPAAVDREERVKRPRAEEGSEMSKQSPLKSRKIAPEVFLELRGLRHPILESLIGSEYVASDLSTIGERNVCIITGPNCGGKSTFIRAVGVAVLLAHIGSFVPAAKAVIPVCDRIMTRVGAADRTLRGLLMILKTYK